MERQRALILFFTGFVVLALALYWVIGATPTTSETIIIALAVYSATCIWLIEKGHKGLRTSLIGLFLFTLGFLFVLDPSIINYERTLSVLLFNFRTFVAAVVTWYGLVLMMLGGLSMKRYREKKSSADQL